MLTPAERKLEFRIKATREGMTLGAAAQIRLGVTWFHLSEAIADKRYMSAALRERFATYIGRSVADVFGDEHAPSAVA